MSAIHEFHAVYDWIAGVRAPVVVSHQRPDGDSLGSIAAMSLMLRSRGAEPAAVLFDPYPGRYDLLRPMANWMQWADVREIVERQADAVIVLDTCSASQLEPIMPFLINGPPTLIVDHHATRDPIGTRPGDLRLIDESASATCLILAEWLRGQAAPAQPLQPGQQKTDAGPGGAGASAVSPEIGAALFTGIATDTGWFRYSNTDARTLEMAAFLVANGVDANRIYRSLYQQDPVPKIRLVAAALASLQLHAGGRIAVMQLRVPDFAAAGADYTMTEDLANEAARIGCVDTSILFVEEPDGRIRVNFRSKELLDVAMLASRYGGGGHTRAAGARLYGAWDVVVPRLVAEAVEAMGG